MTDETTQGHDERDRKIAALEAKLNALEKKVPETGILSDNFLKRAFFVWGHYFVANLIIGFCFALSFGMLFLFLITLGAIAIN